MRKTKAPFKALRLTAITMLCTASPAFSQELNKEPDPIVKSLQTQLEQELADLGPNARFEIPDGSSGKSLVMRYQTRKFMVYPSGKAGRLGRELVEWEGPDDEGILLRVHVQAKGEINQAVVPQTIASPYWKTYLNVYPVDDPEKQIYLALSYRGRTDKKLIQKIQKIAEAGARETATNVDSKSADEKNPKPESEGRPQ